jgi:hypothetical protein
MTRIDLYNEMADRNNHEIITAAEAESFVNNELINWWEFDKDDHGREIIYITVSLDGEEDISRTFIIE